MLILATIRAVNFYPQITDVGVTGSISIIWEMERKYSFFAKT